VSLPPVSSPIRKVIPSSEAIAQVPERQYQGVETGAQFNPMCRVEVHPLTCTLCLYSYNLFASNVILATISFVYFPHARWCGLVINLFTLLG
jgi:hypothetical protein